MAINVTSGSKTANSFCTVAEADEFLEASGWDVSLWDALDDEEKENLLILAALALNNLSWIGWKCYERQNLAWPRWFEEEEYFTADTISLPDDIKKTQAFLAFDVIYRGIQGRTSPSAGPATDAVKSLSLFGDISLSFGNATEVPLRDGISLTGLLRAGHPEIYLLLSPYVVEIHFIGDWNAALPPDLLDEVAPTD